MTQKFEKSAIIPELSTCQKEESVVTPYGIWPKRLLEKAAQIRFIVTDVDGVLTDGTIYFDAQGETFKAFNSKDGLGLRLTLDYGYQWAVITGRISSALYQRMKDFGIHHIHQGITDKKEILQQLLEKLDYTPEQTMFIGDDLIDLEAMQMVGLSVAVADAHPWVKQHAHWSTSNDGGKGALREACDLLLMSCPNSPFFNWVKPCNISF